MARWRNVVSSLFFSVLIFGCTGSDIVKPSGELHITDKSVTLPIGDLGLKGALKKALRADGWAVVVTEGPYVEKKTSDTEVEGRRSFSTRYRIITNTSQIDHCIGMGPTLRYELTMLDNTTGDEALSMSGTECQDNIVKKFMTQVRASE